MDIKLPSKKIYLSADSQLVEKPHDRSDKPRGDFSKFLDNDDRLNRLIDLYKEIKKFRLDSSGKILENFRKKDGSFCLTRLEINDNKFKLSSTAICNRVVNQYKKPWAESGKRHFIEETNGKNTKNQTTEMILKDYNQLIKGSYEKIFTQLCDRAKPQQYEHPDEFTTLSILSSTMPNKIEGENKETGKNVVKLLCKEFLWNKFIYSTGSPHPYVYYKFSQIIDTWYDEIKKEFNETYDDFKNSNNSQLMRYENFETYVSETIYKDAKYELYRQLTLASADDKSKFDVKRLIYSMLIINKNNKYSNKLIIDLALDLIFEQQLKTGLLPIGHVVSNDFAIKNCMFEWNEISGESGKDKDRFIKFLTKEFNIKVAKAEDIKKENEENIIITASSAELYNISLIRNGEKTEVVLKKTKGGKIITRFKPLWETDNGKLKSICHKEITAEYTLLTAKPILSSVECFSDLLAHASFEPILGRKYEENLETLFNWLRENLRKADPKDAVSNESIELACIGSSGVGTDNNQKSTSGDKTQKELSRSAAVIGWTSEYEGISEPVSWVSAHSLIFIDEYYKLLFKEIERIIDNDLHAIPAVNLDNKFDFDTLCDSYNALNFIRKLYTDNDKTYFASDDYRSALLFGPPGSGKSTVAKALAKRLGEGWKYVEITPGQFLDQGDQNIIKNAYSIFKKLTLMENAVVFFDEVDQLIKARTDSTESLTWIVTALLPKFQELRECKKIIFILAMNNVRGADPAALRQGRIDFVLPLGGIYWKCRLRLLQDKLKDESAVSDNSSEIPSQDIGTDESNDKNRLPEELKELVKFKIEDLYVFSWNDNINSINGKLMDFLKKKLGIDFGDNEKIAKIGDDTISGPRTTLSLKRNGEITEVILKIDGVRKDGFIAKKENNELKIYYDSKKLVPNLAANFLKRTDHMPIHEVKVITKLFAKKDFNTNNPLYRIIFIEDDTHPDLNKYVDKDFLDFHLNLLGHIEEGVDLRDAFRIPSNLMANPENDTKKIIIENIYETYPCAWFSRGIYFLVKGEFKNACDAFDNAILEDPTNEKALRYRDLAKSRISKFSPKGSRTQ